MAIRYICIMYAFSLKILNSLQYDHTAWYLKANITYLKNCHLLKLMKSDGINSISFVYFKSRKENPQKLTQLSSKSHPRHLVGKRTAQKDTIIDITSDSQVNSNFPNRWSPVSLAFNNYFYLFLYLYITWITINNNAPHLKSPKNQNRRAALGRPAIKITGGLESSCELISVSINTSMQHRICC